jgi:hypothetical protein
MKKQSSAVEGSVKGKITRTDLENQRCITCFNCGRSEILYYSDMTDEIAEDLAVNDNWKKSGRGKKANWFCPFYSCEESYQNINNELLFAEIKKLLGDAELKLWVPALGGHNMVGSFNHVGGGDALFPTKEACQSYIDNDMSVCLGSPPRARYYPIPVILNKRDEAVF